MLQSQRQVVAQSLDLSSDEEEEDPDSQSSSTASQGERAKKPRNVISRAVSKMAQVPHLVKVWPSFPYLWSLFVKPP